MLRISRLADYAIVVMGCLADDRGGCRSATALATAAGLPEPTVAKILKLLSKSGLLTATRGSAGGYYLAKAPQQISVAAIVTAMDGPIGLTSCADGAVHDCQLSGRCAMKGRWDVVNTALKDALENVSLADMIMPVGLPAARVSGE